VTQFSDLGLAEILLRALAHAGYTTPTPIQAGAIPALLEGRDLLGIAQTGTGKTAAFALPILDRLLRGRKRPLPRSARALVLAPTRELAAQIAKSFRTYGRFAQMSVATVVGGVSIGPQTKALSHGVDILVATPGRLIDHLLSGNLRLDTTEIVVLDEADHMLDLGFIVPIRQIIARLPAERQNLFFSATMPKEIAGLAAEMLRNPIEVRVSPTATTADRIAQEVYLIEGNAKRDLLVELLTRPEFRRTIVFTRTKRGADRVSSHLEAAGIAAVAIHGNKSQNQRQRALDDFRLGRTNVLVATDIAARGIDVDGVTHVVNFELPEVPEAYVHRIGRTARAGAEGAAVSLCDNSERGLLRGIEKLTRQTLPVVDRRASHDHQSMDLGKPQPSRQNKPARGNQALHPDNARFEQRRGHGQNASPQAAKHQPGRPQAAKPQHARSGDTRPAGNGQRVDRSARRGGAAFTPRVSG
jgi:ATP-dependent RNA helicase RhlE